MTEPTKRDEGKPPVNKGVTGVATIINAVIEKREKKNLEDIANEVALLADTPDRSSLVAIEGEGRGPQPVERGNGGIVSRNQPTDPLYRGLLQREPRYAGVRDADQDYWNIQWLRAVRTNDVVLQKTARAKSDEAYQRANLLEGVLDASDPTAILDGSASSYLPQSFAQNIDIAKGAVAVIAPLCTNYTTPGATLRVPTTTQVVAVQASEGAAPAEANPTVASVMMILTKTGARIILSDELLADMPFNLMTSIAPNVGRGIGLKEDTLILQTDGTSPNITGALAGGAVSEATANSLYYVDLATLFFALGKAYQNNATWLAGTLVATILTNLTDGNGNQVLQPRDMPMGPVTDIPLAGAIGKIFGRPVYHVPAVAGDLIFGDLTSYGVVRKGGIEVKVSTEVGFASDTVQFKFTQRWDGQMLDAAGIKEIQGITTLGA
jgi:HK97 family phage major capsid protein